MALDTWFYREIGLRCIDYARKTRTVSELKKLRETEYASSAELRQLQFDRLKALLRHCRDNVRFYRERFHACGFNPDTMESFSDLQVIPVLTKDDIRANFDAMKASDFSSFRPRIKETGGSTGQPLKLYHDEWSHSMMWANIYRGFGHAGYMPGDRYLTIASGSLLPKKLKRGFKLYFALQNSIVYPSYHLDERMATELRELIVARRPLFIYGYSSTLVQFARSLAAQNLTVDGLKAVFTTADMLYPHQRQLIESSLRAPVFDNYGCPEAGVMTWECTEHDGYHYNMESCFLETVDDNDKGAGRLISTNLANWAFPIVRYDTGDIGKIEDTGQCRCGRSHDKVRSLLGRQRDIITLPSGRMLHGAFFNHLKYFYDDERILRFQIIQPQSDTVEVHLELVAGCVIDDFAFISQELQALLDYEVVVSLIEGQFRESAVSRKHRVVISDVDNVWTG
ncbi:capsular polysaccharide biosynthesis protein [Thiohalobacter sp. COW1]|uniref:phenylacetate--CoA ligase family protein n=1 Tax=Thiohalobacter sp. COW1 TaxID=2795687 RepID=UPI001915179A|nr:phenylacetate--CoA ligase family protein [Thiohalobacter sp. COW1]BCO31998.1 capsular polysaccharide biosynthesis protein [Thiohalobacter sp. COW1]